MVIYMKRLTTITVEIDTWKKLAALKIKDQDTFDTLMLKMVDRYTDNNAEDRKDV